MKKIVLFCLALLAIAGFSATVFPAPQQAYAGTLVDSAKCQESANTTTCPVNCPDPASGVTVTDPKCAAARDCSSVDANGCNVVAKYLNPLINAVTILAGVAIVIGIIVGGIQYASSGGDPQKAATGKKHIKMAVIALLGLLFMSAFLQFLIPGGNTLLQR